MQGVFAKNCKRLHFGGCQSDWAADSGRYIFYSLLRLVFSYRHGTQAYLREGVSLYRKRLLNS